MVLVLIKLHNHWAFFELVWSGLNAGNNPCWPGPQSYTDEKRMQGILLFTHVSVTLSPPEQPSQPRG